MKDDGRKTGATASDDIRLIARTQDRDAFARLFHEYAPRVKAHLVRRGASSELAEDLAQETLARVWRRAGTFDPAQASPAAWIFAIARNLRIDAIRRERHPTALDGALDSTQSEPETPAEVFESGERERRIQTALRDLPADQREVLRLSFFLGHTHAQIAEELGLPLGTVKSRLRLALVRVRNHLGDL